jgi:hypothetical protein
MQVGTSCPTRPVVKPVCTLQLPAGTYYEMDDEAGWHSVRPLGGPSLSLMVTLAPWKNPVPFPKPQKALLTLTRHEQDRLLHDMREALFL